MSQKGHPLLPTSFPKQVWLYFDTTVNVCNAPDALLTKWVREESWWHHPMHHAPSGLFRWRWVHRNTLHEFTKPELLLPTEITAESNDPCREQQKIIPDPMHFSNPQLGYHPAVHSISTLQSRTAGIWSTESQRVIDISLNIIQLLDNVIHHESESR